MHFLCLLLSLLTSEAVAAVVEVTKCCPVHSVLVEVDPGVRLCRPREELSIDEANKTNWKPTFYEYDGINGEINFIKTVKGI